MWRQHEQSERTGKFQEEGLKDIRTKLKIKNGISDTGRIQFVPLYVDNN